MENEINTFIKIGVVALRNQTGQPGEPIDLFVKVNQLEQSGLVIKDTLKHLSKCFAIQYDTHLKSRK